MKAPRPIFRRRPHVPDVCDVAADELGPFAEMCRGLPGACVRALGQLPEEARTLTLPVFFARTRGFARVRAGGRILVLDPSAATPSDWVFDPAPLGSDVAATWEGLRP